MNINTENLVSISEASQNFSKIAHLVDEKCTADGIRNEALLDLALSVPFQTFGGVELYPSTVAKIARTAYGLLYAITRLRMGTSVLVFM